MITNNMHSGSPKVLISILNWNAPENTARTVDSVLSSDYKLYDIVILDNNSGDYSIDFLSACYPTIQLIKIKKNLGYAGAHKIVAERAKIKGYELLWILNNDVEVFDDSLTALVSAYKRNKTAIFGSVTLMSDGLTINSCGGHEMTDAFTSDEKSGYNIYQGKKINELEIKERPVSGIQGSSMLIPLDVIKKFGFMDTRYFLYGEETEYSYRLREKFGIQTIVAPKSKVIHHGGGSFKKSDKLNWVRIYYATRNDILVHRRYSRTFNNHEVELKKIPRFIYYFLKHFLITSKSKKDYTYWCSYYKKLGTWHALLNLRGKYLRPEDFIR